MYTPSHLAGRWLFGKLGCNIYGFLASTTGLLSICNLAAIGADRYLAISSINSSMQRKMTFGRAYRVVILLWLWNLGWSSAPLFGWNRYVTEGFAMTCSFDYLDRDPMSQNFVLALFLSCFGLPLIILVFCYSQVYSIVHQHQLNMANMAKSMGDDKDKRRNMDREIKLLIASLLATGGWLICWTPYAIICLVGTFGDYTLLTPLNAELPAIFAKTATVINPIIYSLRSPNFQKGMREVFPWLPSGLFVSSLEGTFHKQSTTIKNVNSGAVSQSQSGNNDGSGGISTSEISVITKTP